MDIKQMKLDELRALVRAWKKEKSLTLAYDICEFLAQNLSLEAETANPGHIGPRIRDEKIRNAFKAWVETFANPSNTSLAFKYDAERYSFNNYVADSTLEFAGCDGIECEDRQLYTLEELCGEEEE